MDTPKNQPCGPAGGLILLTILVLRATGCTSAPPTAAELRQQDERGLAAATKSAQAPGNAQPGGPVPVPARIDERPVPWSELEPLLAEASGGLILRDLALDRAVRDECAFKNISVSNAEVDAERDLLLASIERDAATSAADSGVLLESVRRARGLGETRFKNLLERNARLRALVRSSVVVTDDDVEQALQIRYGERYRIRVIVTAAERDAIDLRGALSKEGALDVMFARAAAIKSIDPSAVRGGLTEPISPVDQLYPASIRALLPTLRTDAVSAVVGVERGFAICILDSAVPAVERPEGAAAAAGKEIRVRKERLAMEEAAKRLLARVRVVPLDGSLEWSWRGMKGK